MTADGAGARRKTLTSPASSTPLLICECFLLFSAEERTFGVSYLVHHATSLARFRVLSGVWYLLALCALICGLHASSRCAIPPPPLARALAVSPMTTLFLCAHARRPPSSVRPVD